MRVPLSWLREYVDVDLPPGELAHRLTMAGVEVGDVIEIGSWDGCVVGEVLSVRPHPQADRLSLCQVATGVEQLEVVCGAPNVAAGQKVCFARVGAVIYNTHSGRHEELKAARIRGVVSEGMICSELELGLGEGHEGIVVLPDDAPLGVPLDDYMGDTILELELTPNRLDCLSILGTAHEVGALTGKTVTPPNVEYPQDGPPVSDGVSISIADPDLCRRYTATVIRGISIGPSPAWMQERLTRAGVRPINNVVDVTNYVMLEFNQPLHAFDYRSVKDRTVIVRRARPGESLTTLDGVEHRLSSNILVIADSDDPIGLGGVIGGANSEIGPETTDVLLESATFDGRNNRETAQSLRLRTEATLRFEKGLRPELAPIALRRATQLIQRMAGGTVDEGIVDVFPEPGDSIGQVPLSAGKLKRVLGMDLEIGEAARVLESLGFDCHLTGEDSLSATVPYWRNDVSIEEDLVEEVVRIIGYDSVPTTMLSTPIPYHQARPMTGLVAQVKDLLASAGMQEVINYPLVSLEDLQRVNQDDEPNSKSETSPLRLSNPMNAEQAYLRPTLRASLLSTLAVNQGHVEGPFQLFEVGRVFHPRDGQLPEERETAAGVLAGRRAESSWLQDQGSEDGLLDFYDAKGVVDSVLARLGIYATYEPAEDPSCAPGRCARVLVDGATHRGTYPTTTGRPEESDEAKFCIGVLGELHPGVISAFDLNAPRVSLWELDIEALLGAVHGRTRKFQTLSRYPAATRDLALLVPSDVPEARIEQIIFQSRLVTNVELFDLYTGENLPEGSKSLAFHVHFQSHQQTLTTEQVNRALDGILRNLERQVGASLRS